MWQAKRLFTVNGLLGVVAQKITTGVKTSNPTQITLFYSVTNKAFACNILVYLTLCRI
jgi:hypothetical protein